MPRRVLIAEYLLADTFAWNSAPSSMQIEAAAMLSAVVADFAALSDVITVVLLGSTSLASMCVRLPESTEVIQIASHGVLHWLQDSAQLASGFAATLLIAPECDRVLDSILSELQGTSWNQAASLNISAAQAALLSDKLSTARWLSEHALATPQTISLSDNHARAFIESAATNLAAPGQSSFVLKPRFGAGSDRVHVVHSTSDALTGLTLQSAADDPWIMQPFVHGEACSVGIIGGRTVAKPIVLPPARQTIVQVNGQLAWTGGEVPLLHADSHLLTSAARRFADAIGPFAGYVGVDAVLTKDDTGQPSVQLIEVNPRLCTSYVGYREYCRSNLAACMIDPAFNMFVNGNGRPIRFSANGDCEALNMN